MKPSELPILPDFFDRYIRLAPEVDLIEGLENSLYAFDAEIDILTRIQDQPYQSGKWTPKDVIQHITDNERIQSYRALRIMRGDQTVLPGFDENLIAENANTKKIPIEHVIAEFKLVRASTIHLFAPATKEMLLRTGNCSGIDISTLALGFVCVGHQKHHQTVLEQRYFELK